jgi:hypothetical protein
MSLGSFPPQGIVAPPGLHISDACTRGPCQQAINRNLSMEDALQDYTLGAEKSSSPRPLRNPPTTIPSVPDNQVLKSSVLSTKPLRPNDVSEQLPCKFALAPGPVPPVLSWCEKDQLKCQQHPLLGMARQEALLAVEQAKLVRECRLEF